MCDVPVRNDDWGLAGDLAQVSAAATDGLMWLADAGELPDRRRRMLDDAMERIEQAAMRIRAHRKLRSEA